jgi:predicted amidohydrolase
MVALTQTGTLPTGAKNLGHSLIYDYSGNILDEINTKEGGISAVLDFDSMYEFRDKCTVLKDIRDSYEVMKL